MFSKNIFDSSHIYRLIQTEISIHLRLCDRTQNRYIKTSTLHLNHFQFVDTVKQRSIYENIFMNFPPNWIQYNRLERKNLKKKWDNRSWISFFTLWQYENGNVKKINRSALLVFISSAFFYGRDKWSVILPCDSLLCSVTEKCFVHTDMLLFHIVNL